MSTTTHVTPCSVLANDNNVTAASARPQPTYLTARSIRSGSATQLDAVATRIVGAINNEVFAAAGHWAEGHNGKVGVHAYQERPQDQAKAAALYAVGDHTL